MDGCCGIADAEEGDDKYGEAEDAEVDAEEADAREADCDGVKVGEGALFLGHQG